MKPAASAERSPGKPGQGTFGRNGASHKKIDQLAVQRIAPVFLEKPGAKPRPVFFTPLLKWRRIGGTPGCGEAKMAVRSGNISEGG